MPDRACAPALATLYTEHHGWLLAWLRRRLGDSAHAADLAHDTFLRILAGRRLSDIREPRAYLRTVAHGILVNTYERQALERAYLDALAARPEALAPSPEDRYLVLETLLRIDALLDALPAKVRRAFLLSQLDGQRYEDIARELGCSLPSIKRYMKQAFLHCLTVLDE